jgi:beta-galactosidase
MPSVKKKDLGLEITVNNPTAGPLAVKLRNEIVPLGGKDAEKTLAVKELQIAAGKEQTIQLAEKWDNPKLWWPDDPRQYQVVTKLEIGGQVVDVKRTKFGFREWEWTGQAFKLNGVPWHLRADLQDFDTKDPEQAVKNWHKSGQNMFRYWGERPWTGSTQEETLDFFDAHGIPVRRSGIFDGEAASYLLVNGPRPRTAVFDNWRHQLKAWVKAERNHPSVFVWSIENEITYINSRNFGWLDQEEPEIRKAAQEVMALDPTRPAMIDGGDALRDRSLPVYGSHYIEAPLREYPDEAYTLARAFRTAGKPGPNPWPIGDDRPLCLGETFFASGSTPSAYAQVGGESCFLGWSDARQGVGLLAKIMSEGYRWHGVAAFHFWFGSDRADLHYNSWQPVCVLCREWNWAFGSGQEVRRTLKVFNDTRFDDPIEMHWQFRLGDRTVAEGGMPYNIAPGLAEETTIRFQAPVVKERTSGELILTCARKGQEVFREVKPLAILDTHGAPRPAVVGAELAVLDPRGVVKDRLKKRDIPFTSVDSPDAVTAGTKLLVVGSDALTPRQATDPCWLALAAAGTRLLVLDQENPLHYQAVPADLDVTGYDGRIAFPENLDHPAFAGLGQSDFFTWSGDSIVYRHAYKKASRGARSLVQCDEELSCSALTECAVRDSVMLLCQLAVGTRLDSDPVAQRLFDNMLAYCAAYRPIARTTAVVLPADDLRRKLLDAAGLRSQKAEDLVAAVCDRSRRDRRRRRLARQPEEARRRPVCRQGVHGPRRLVDALGPDARRAGGFQPTRGPAPRHPAVQDGARDAGRPARPAHRGPDDARRRAGV